MKIRFQKENNTDLKEKRIATFFGFVFLILVFLDPGFGESAREAGLPEHIWSIICITIAIALLVLAIVREIKQILEIRANDTVLAYKGHLIIIDKRTVRVFEDGSLKEIPADEWVASQGGWNKIFNNAFIYTTGKKDILKESKSKNNGTANLNA